LSIARHTRCHTLLRRFSKVGQIKIGAREEIDVAWLDCIWIAIASLDWHHP